MLQSWTDPWYLICNDAGMNDKTFNIALDYEGIHYKGWVTPSEKKHDDGQPRSYHVVLNDTLFGNLSKTDDKWVIDEQRPAGMVDQVGGLIQENWK
jgi:hypothetical protein